MSVVNVFNTGTRIFMMTDSSHYNADCEIVEFASKAYTIDCWNGAVSGRGNLWGPQTVQLLADEYGSFDDFIDLSADRLRDMFHEFEAIGGFTAQSLMEITVIGWSEREDAPRIFMLNSEPTETRDAFVWTDLEEWTTGPALGVKGLYRLHRDRIEPGHDYQVADFDPHKHGLPIMEVQRRTKTESEYVPGEPFHCIGGQVWLTELTREGVKQSVLHDWKDEVGLPISPELDKPESELRVCAPSFVPLQDAARYMKMKREGLIDPETLLPWQPGARPRAVSESVSSIAPPMNRQQRRHQERQASKSKKRQVA
jgi:hypothetical protein